MFVTAIIAAGGRGQRFGGAQPKQFALIGGRAILERSVAAFVDHPRIDEVVVAVSEEIAAEPPSYLRGSAARIVVGGARRQDSVANAFRAASPASDVIVIHDAARPLIGADLISRTIAEAAASGAAVAAIAARDTVKLRSAGAHVVQQTLPRELVFLAQTPQAFRREVLEAALSIQEDATDEAGLAERAGHRVTIVEGDATNIKITTPDDLIVAEAIASRSAKPVRTGRAGTGYDLHRLVAGRKLVLGGITVPSDVGALGYSDADVVCHAVTDAILGAASLGDIGRHFPDTDPKWKDASSLDLLSRACAIVREGGHEIGNVDVTVILERPKIKDHVDAMRSAVAAAIGIEPDRVSIKGKTNEGIDAIGRGEAIAAHAIALIRQRGERRER